MVYKYLLIECLIMLSRQLNCQFRTACHMGQKKTRYAVGMRLLSISGRICIGCLL